jgi:hypothetical protein
MPKPLSPKKPTPPEDDPLMDADEIAEFTRMKREYVTHLFRTGALRGYPRNAGEKRHVWVGRRSDVIAYLEQKAKAAQAQPEQQKAKTAQAQPEQQKAKTAQAKEKPVVYGPKKKGYTKPGSPCAEGGK